MADSLLNRRNSLKALGAAVGLSLLPEVNLAKPAPKLAFTYCLNMSTIRGQNLGFVKELETASKAGFRSVEIWMNSLETYLSGGGTIADARKRIGDLGLKIENAIGFANWIVDDDAARQKGLDLLKREMELLAQLGCKRTAAPPAGATNTPGLDLKKAAERYRKILELGDQTGVVPQLELWGFSKNLSRLSEVLYVATESGHPSARLLLDVYHLYKGGTSLDSLHLVGKPGIEIFHVNDYSASSSPATITDADRIYTGEGVAPIGRILQALRQPDKPLIISFEVFNKGYYTQDALLVAQTALAKMKAATKGV
ncbi:xylose isomerase [Adhaeribacter aerolatus]|uniref:Xylose isomerase n=1 Tax=Adhaeribacter aerolatus TaxID=670289 RepID=A0A512B171_9BACT|nr:sugar phosphate isomerase/epimerase family protein [Adhaeribacter aerolatus]GEO05718.1 xylose isomerase [Adhaeribacter aerolatus]